MDDDSRVTSAPRRFPRPPGRALDRFEKAEPAVRAALVRDYVQAATARVTATSPWTGTHMIASYQWAADHRSLTPGNLYSTQSFRPMPGLNIYVRQPIPIALLPWRMEATADLRNMLAQGYLPIGMANGQQMVLVQTPRSFRGGLSFIF